MKPLLLCKNCGAPVVLLGGYKDYIHESRENKFSEFFSCQYTKGYEHLDENIYAEPEAEKPSQLNTSAIDELFS